MILLLLSLLDPAPATPTGVSSACSSDHNTGTAVPFYAVCR